MVLCLEGHNDGPVDGPVPKDDAPIYHLACQIVVSWVVLCLRGHPLLGVPFTFEEILQSSGAEADVPESDAFANP